jgi:hypothetical protein
MNRFENTEKCFRKAHFSPDRGYPAVPRVLMPMLETMLEAYTDEQIRRAIDAADRSPEDFPAGFKKDLAKVLRQKEKAAKSA